MGLLTLLARRFVAGERAEAAIAVGRRLGQRGILATFDLLGENVHDEASARGAAADVAGLLRAIPTELERNVSVKLTQMGLDVSPDLCRELMTDVVQVARDVDGFVRIDMEGSRFTQGTLDVFQRLREKFDNVGIVLQAALHRTTRDVEDAIARGDRVRLCKGAYREPATIAWTSMDDVRASYVRCARSLLESGYRPAIATHDERLILQVLSWASELGLSGTDFEFQMLYGLRPRRWDELVRAGYCMRVYVPFGTHWLPYFLRRLRERRENVLFVLRNLIRG